LYSRIPHPMYVFLDIFLLGTIIMVRQTWLLLIWGALIVLQAWQAKREETILEKAFGDEYREYRERTWW
jgi:protein-S-isoprenylcysteine O-methyltransferase Ste14